MCSDKDENSIATRGTYGHLWDFKHAKVISDGSHHTDNPVLIETWLIVQPCQLGEGDWTTVDAGHEQPLQDHPVESGVCTASQEAVQLQRDSAKCLT